MSNMRLIARKPKHVTANFRFVSGHNAGIIITEKL